jgi:hypothetical protein
MARIAIQPDNLQLTSGRLQSFSTAWSAQLQRTGHEVVLVDAYRPRFIESLTGCDGFMWWFGQPPRLRNLGKRLLPALEHGLGIPVFPTWRTIWHFDDKVAQKYLLEAAGIPMPETHVFWSPQEALAFADSARYPWVIKLASGITSQNVALLPSAADARFWIRRLFGRGAASLNRDGAIVRLARRLVHAARAARTGTSSSTGTGRDLEKGFLLLQEFLDGNAFDTRVTVIGNRAFAFRRFNRPNDFRASGSGRIDWDPAPIAEDAVALAFRVARTLGAQSVAVDVLRRNGQPVINEISYYYEGWAVAACAGHWRLQNGRPDGVLEWVPGKVTPEDAILTDFLHQVGA